MYHARGDCNALDVLNSSAGKYLGYFQVTFGAVSKPTQVVGRNAVNLNQSYAAIEYEQFIDEY